MLYIYDAAGNITQMKDDAQQTIYFANQVVAPICKYTYDSLYRLKKATGRELNGLVQPSASDCPIQTPVPDTETNACRNYTLNYNYDELGNILQIQHIAQNGNWTRDYFYPTDSNKLIGHEEGQTDYTYDEAGNMLSMPHLNNMAWDEDDMLVEADLGGGGTAYYRNDSGGNRVRKVIINGSTKKERFYINDFELWQQSTNGTIETERETLSISDDEKTFLQLETLTIDNGKAISAPTTNWRYQYDNHLGSACLELDDSANVISYEEYYPFGATSYRSGKSAAEVSLKRYRYCGKERDEETGLYYYGARFYAAWIGRFISVDPLAEYYPSISPYSYTFNNPVNWTDSTGMCPDGDCPDDAKEGDTHQWDGEIWISDGDGNWNRDGGTLDEVVVYYRRNDSDISNQDKNTLNNDNNYRYNTTFMFAKEGAKDYTLSSWGKFGSSFTPRATGGGETMYGSLYMTAYVHKSDNSETYTLEVSAFVKIDNNPKNKINSYLNVKYTNDKTSRFASESFRIDQTLNGQITPIGLTHVGSERFTLPNDPSELSRLDMSLSVHKDVPAGGISTIQLRVNLMAIITRENQ